MKSLFDRNLMELLLFGFFVLFMIFVFIAYTNTNTHYYNSMRQCMEIGGNWVADGSTRTCRLQGCIN